MKFKLILKDAGSQSMMMMMMMIEPERLTPVKDTENRANPQTQIITDMLEFNLKQKEWERTNKTQQSE